MNCSVLPEDEYFGGGPFAYSLLLNAVSQIPIAHYISALSLAAAVLLYNFLDFHFLEDVRYGLRGRLVKLTCDHSSEIYVGVVSKCPVLHGR